MPAAPSPSNQQANPRARLVPTRVGRAHSCCYLLLLLAALMPAGILAAPRDTENRVKAAFLYHFTKFVEWPQESLPDENTPLHICVLGDSALKPQLLPLQNRQAGTHPLSVRHIETGGDFTSCQLLYLPRHQQVRLQHLLDKLEPYPILTVSSIPDFAERGGMIGFVLRDNRVRLQMNLGAIHSAGLQVNAQLIEVCERVFRPGATTTNAEHTP